MDKQSLQLCVHNFVCFALRLFHLLQRIVTLQEQENTTQSYHSVILRDLKRLFSVNQHIYMTHTWRTGRSIHHEKLIKFLARFVARRENP